MDVMMYFHDLVPWSAALLVLWKNVCLSHWWLKILLSVQLTVDFLFLVSCWPILRPSLRDDNPKISKYHPVQKCFAFDQDLKILFHFGVQLQKFDSHNLDIPVFCINSKLREGNHWLLCSLSVQFYHSVVFFSRSSVSFAVRSVHGSSCQAVHRCHVWFYKTVQFFFSFPKWTVFTVQWAIQWLHTLSSFIAIITCGHTFMPWIILL